MSSMDINNCCSGQEILESEIELSENSITEDEFYSDKENQSKKRMDVCRECPELVGPLNNCRQCGCFMNIKVRIYSAKCPLDKW